jgi:hypothetical protein
MIVFASLQHARKERASDETMHQQASKETIGSQPFF